LKRDPLREISLEAIKLDRYNANRAPILIAFVADERKGGEENGEKKNDFRLVETDKQKAAREYYEFIRQYPIFSDAVSIILNY